MNYPAPYEGTSGVDLETFWLLHYHQQQKKTLLRGYNIPPYYKELNSTTSKRIYPFDEDSISDYDEESVITYSQSTEAIIQNDNNFNEMLSIKDIQLKQSTIVSSITESTDNKHQILCGYANECLQLVEGKYVVANTYFIGSIN